MLAKKYRLPLRTEFHRLQKEGELHQFPLFAFLLAKNGLELSRFSFIVSKKIHKRAVRRNKVKRRLRAAVAQLLSRVKPGFDVVFLVKKEILKKDFHDLRKAVENSFRKVRLC